MPRPESPDSLHTCYHEGDITILNTAILEIKDTLRDLKDLLTSNAVLEEQAVQFRENIADLHARLHALELRVARADGSGRWVEKVIWGIIGAGLSVLAVGFRF